MDGELEEGHPKFNPQLGWGLNQRPSFGQQSEILPTVPTSILLHVHFDTL